jgi:hypothetical protein
MQTSHAGFNGEAVAPTLTLRSKAKGGKAARREAKKRHVEVVTRLPTERLATACWAFIVAKSIPLEAAPMLDFRPLQAANREIHQQLIHRTGRWAVAPRDSPASARFRRQIRPASLRF